MITSEEPNVSLNGRYSITQTCAILGIHRNSLRKYTEQGLIRCGFRRQPVTRRFYSGAEIKRFWHAQY